MKIRISLRQRDGRTVTIDIDQSPSERNASVRWEGMAEVRLDGLHHSFVPWRRHNSDYEIDFPSLLK